MAKNSRSSSRRDKAKIEKRGLEEGLVAELLFDKNVELVVVPHLYDLKADGTGVIALQGVPGDMVLLSWLYPRAPTGRSTVSA